MKNKYENSLLYFLYVIHFSIIVYPQQSEILNHKPILKFLPQNIIHEKSRIPEIEGQNQLFINKKNTKNGNIIELNPKVPRIDYYSVYFKDELNGIAVGEMGTIIITTDGGITWSDHSISTNKTFLRISGSKNFIVIVGKDGIIIESTNFGETWEIVNSGSSTNIWGVSMINDSTCYVCTNDGIFLRTADAGKTWLSNSIDYKLTYWDLNFIDSTLGFVSCSNGMILKTQNGGLDWEANWTGDFYSLYSIEILSNGNIITAGLSGQIYYSTDHGNSFAPAEVPINFSIEDLAFSNPNNGIAIGQVTATSAILKTTNGGVNWNLVKQDMGKLNIFFVSDSIGYNVGADLKIYKTVDQGETWKREFLNDDLYDIDFVSETTGYICSSELYITTNGGSNWEIIPNSPGGYSIKFLDTLTGFLGGYDASIQKTTDGGLNWYSTNNITGDGKIKKIDFSNNTTGWALAKSFYKTTNTGETWEPVLNKSNLQGFYFIDELNGWVVGDEIYKTNDGGKNWESITIPYVFHYIVFTNNKDGYAVSNQLYKTIDGGLTWSLVTGINGTKLKIVDSTSFITMGVNDFTITYDNWKTWKTFNLTDINSLEFLNNGTGYFVGNTGLVLEYCDSTIMPVELISFKSEIENNNVLLTWQTASELNNKGFNIGKSIDKENWNSIGFVEGKGTTSNVNDYSFIDKNIMHGTQYYRLKQIDYNGSNKYSDIVEVNSAVNALSFNLSQNYPNPFNPETNIEFTIPKETVVNISVYDVIGRKVCVLVNEKKQPGNYSIKLKGSELSAGVYFYRLTTSIGYTAVRKLIILK